MLFLQGHDVWLLTAPSVYNPLSYMEKRVWVEKHFGLARAHKLIIAYNKAMIEGDVLIDDGSCHGQREFGGTWLRFGGSAYPDWDSVLRGIDKLSNDTTQYEL